MFEIGDALDAAVAQIEAMIRTDIKDSQLQYEIAKILLEKAKADAGIDGEAKDGFVKENGDWFFYEDGKVKTGWHKADYGTWYFLDDKGVMATGWRMVDGKWYFFENWGGMATGWRKLNGTWYYLNPSGAMATGWKKVNGTWYYLNQSGAMATGWKKVGGKWYFLLPSGAMASNRALNIGGRVYRFAASGEML